MRFTRLLLPALMIAALMTMGGPSMAAWQSEDDAVDSIHNAVLDNPEKLAELVVTSDLMYWTPESYARALFNTIDQVLFYILYQKPSKFAKIEVGVQSLVELASKTEDPRIQKFSNNFVKRFNYAQALYMKRSCAGLLKSPTDQGS